MKTPLFILILLFSCCETPRTKALDIKFVVNYAHNPESTDYYVVEGFIGDHKSYQFIEKFIMDSLLDNSGGTYCAEFLNAACKYSIDSSRYLTDGTYNDCHLLRFYKNDKEATIIRFTNDGRILSNVIKQFY